MKYLKAEQLKFKRTIFNKLIVIAPFLTAVFAWLVGGFYGFQYMTFYWWYAFLLPGTIAILCFLSHQKEERAGNYYSIFSMPINLKRFEFAKAIILIEKLVIAGILLAVFSSISNIISPTLAVYSIGHGFVGSSGLIIASIWQIPICLFLVRKAGMFLSIIGNTLLGILSPIMFGKTMFAWICPYCWGAKFAEMYMGIRSNGTFLGEILYSWKASLPIVLSALLFILLSFLDARSFLKREGR